MTPAEDQLAFNAAVTYVVFDFVFAFAPMILFWAFTRPEIIYWSGDATIRKVWTYIGYTHWVANLLLYGGIGVIGVLTFFSEFNNLIDIYMQLNEYGVLIAGGIWNLLVSGAYLYAAITTHEWEGWLMFGLNFGVPVFLYLAYILLYEPLVGYYMTAMMEQFEEMIKALEEILKMFEDAFAAETEDSITVPTTETTDSDNWSINIPLGGDTSLDVTIPI